ncbi:hypothetical protein JYT97_02515 [Haliea sp. AH-315-K21]|uniref:Uncharacterized protein n=1 Tax=SAR86 cluster bacterium TaxID=2030880 RepID=A0A2A5C763_9GAMM|nr:hypothetical protein [Haliea sp. AH-315-K21]MBN4059712.1 hypothetical protein [bacterium AH-315-I11]MBN4075886.1 hypothetical protein [Gammaproteobacteria bacterium AH-315-E17]PCJ39647.1 MAG: hypothetical protein COA71_13455 [SAR86 cluster bacterium]
MKPALTISIVFFALAANTNATAQTFSYDGNRWYEIEVSIFTNQSARAINPELFLPEHIELLYPQPILQLTPAFKDYLLDFSADNVAINSLTNSSVNPFVSDLDPLQDSAIEIVTYGPELREANTDFRLIDKARDPFVSLAEEEHEFTRFNRNIESSPDHRILFHAVWRQPVLNKIQASAILVTGGDRYGQHNELEGSLIISYNINRVDVDARLWRNSFNIVSDLEWNVPLIPLAAPITDAAIEADSFGLLIDQVYPMLETRQMISNQLHYLDHPALGILIEVRPYELPPLFDFSLD